MCEALILLNTGAEAAAATAAAAAAANPLILKRDGRHADFNI